MSIPYRTLFSLHTYLLSLLSFPQWASPGAANSYPCCKSHRSRKWEFIQSLYLRLSHTCCFISGSKELFVFRMRTISSYQVVTGVECSFLQRACKMTRWALGSPNNTETSQRMPNISANCSSCPTSPFHPSILLTFVPPRFEHLL